MSNIRRTRNAGMHYCCYQLLLHGWDAEPAERNHRGVDIVATNANSGTVEIRLKTLSETMPVPLGPSLDHIHVDLWMIVNGLASPTPRLYMLRPAEIERKAKLQGQDGRLQFWLDLPDYDRPEWRDAWERIEQAATEHAAQQSH